MSNIPVIDQYCTKYWYKDGELRRDGDITAIEYANGNKYWYKDGKKHRDGDLPAVEWANGDKYWYKYDHYYTQKQIRDAYCILKHVCRKFRGYLLIRKMKRVHAIHQELLCKPPTKSYPGGLHYHKFVAEINSSFL